MQPDNTKIWDPVLYHDPSKRKKLLKINVSSFIYSFLATIMYVEVDDGADTDMKEESHTELDSRENIIVVGRHAHVISCTGRIA